MAKDRMVPSIPVIAEVLKEIPILFFDAEFDMLDGKELNDQGKPSRSHYTFIVAGQLPFLSKVLQYCVRGLMPYGNRKVLAENCVFVNSIYSGN